MSGVTGTIYLRSVKITLLIHPEHCMLNTNSRGPCMCLHSHLLRTGPSVSNTTGTDLDLKFLRVAEKENGPFPVCTTLFLVVFLKLPSLSLLGDRPSVGSIVLQSSLHQWRAPQCCFKVSICINFYYLFSNRFFFKTQLLFYLVN